MLQSNLPVQQQDNLWNGAMIGGLVGAGAGYAGQRSIMNGDYEKLGAKMDKRDNNKATERYLTDNKLTSDKSGFIMDGDKVASREQLESYNNHKQEQAKLNAERAEGRAGTRERMAKQFGGSHTKRSAAYAVGGAALGTLIGGVTDTIL